LLSSSEQKDPHSHLPVLPLPPKTLLTAAKVVITTPEAIAHADHTLRKIAITLKQFKIDVSMEGYIMGPTVAQYRLKPHEGVKLARIESLKKDLSLALHAKSIRIQAPIPGMGLVGIEVPNASRATIRIRDVASDPSFSQAESPLALILGRDIQGAAVVADLARMPHLLIAGQTGSGKSVCMNGIIVSLLMRNQPSDLRLILIDPKRVELGIYNHLPHLLAPVINDPGKAINALRWSVQEMIGRYDTLTAAKARNLAEYNKRLSPTERLPHIVIIIDELADLMMSGSKKEVEAPIARIAQMARAVGMHLIVATQRPSVDVITGLIKANIPSRIAFTVASQIDSRTILDRSGAEDLLGRGDMLYFPTGSSAPERVQGVLVDTEEVEAIVNHIKLYAPPDTVCYNPDVTSGKSSSNASGSIIDGM
jgi:DNA segregation ATPase FtsK/SpoIIIE, S-DNA-T family